MWNSKDKRKIGEVNPNMRIDMTVWVPAMGILLIIIK